MFANDPELTALARLNVGSLKRELARCIDCRLLEEPIDRYEVVNVRYQPRKKLVLGLQARGSLSSIAIRIFPPEKQPDRLAQAQRQYPGLVFSLPGLDGVAWLFPAERKLDFRLVADLDQLRSVLLAERGYQLETIALERFVPEHAYTLRIEGLDAAGQMVTDYAKIHDDDSGSRAEQLASHLAAHLADGLLQIPGNVKFLPQERLLLQQALSKLPDGSVSDAEVANVLAILHGIPPAIGLLAEPPAAHCQLKVRSLLEIMFPRWVNRVASLWDRVSRATSIEHTAPVFLHGDVHLGNLFALPHGRLGLIDFDAARLGPAVDDLSSFFGFKVWIAIRQKQSIFELLKAYPAFIDHYNCRASVPVRQKDAWLQLAEKMFSERIHRGLARGKLSGEHELLCFTDVAEQCLVEAERAVHHG